MFSTRAKLLWIFCVLHLFATLKAQTFMGPRQIPISANPASLLTSDLNGDGRPDIVWGDYSNLNQPMVHILLAQANGSYLEAAPVKTATAVAPVCRIADTNQDKNPDLVCIANSNGLEVYLGRGDGSFASAHPATLNYIPVETISGPYDLNGDGIPDFIVGSGSALTTMVLQGDGRGGYIQGAPLTNEPDFPVAVADVNGDGLPDLLYNGPAVALGLGGGRFGPTTPYSAPAPPGRYLGADSCVFADIDHDGHFDSACAEPVLVDHVDITGVVELIVQHGNPDGTFDTQPLMTQIYGDTTNQYNGIPTLSGLFAAQDVNGDGLPDLVESTSDGLGVLLGQPGPAFAYPAHYGVAYALSNPIGPYVLTDLDGDGIADFLSYATNTLVISYGRPDGTFRTVPDLEVARYLQAATVADFNGDGIPDVAVTGDTALELSLGKGDGTFAPYQAVSGPGTSYSTYSYGAGAVLHGDFNGDHRQDLLALSTVGQYDQAPYTLLGNGNGTFAAPVASGFQLTKLAQAQVQDIDRDGRDDVFLSFSNGLAPPELISLLSNGDGTFRQVSSPGPSEPYSSFFRSLCPPRLADFEHTGTLDAVFATVDTLYLARGHGDGTFDLPVTQLALPATAGYTNVDASSVTVGDFDGDGQLDVAVTVDLATPVSGYAIRTAVFLFYGTGGTGFTAGSLAAILPEPNITLQAADLRNEGRPELVTSAGGQPLVVLHTTIQRTVDAPQTLISDLRTTSVTVADLNGDGRLDLLVANGNGNTVDPILNLSTAPIVSGSLVASPEPSVAGQPFTLSATLIPPVAGSALSGTINFSIDGGAVGSAPLSGNVATINVAGSYAAGTHVLAASWPGNATYAAIALSGRHVVSVVASKVTLSSSNNPSQAGQPVTLLATVDGTASTSGAAPSGTVLFTEGTATLATVPLSSGAQASFTTANLAQGSHTLVASYSGDTTFAGGSASLVQVITSLPDSATLSANPNPALVSQPVLLTFSLAGLVSGTTPNGHVTFLDGAAFLGSVAVGASGIANLPVTFGVAGTHALSASFAGDSTYVPASATSSLVVGVLPTQLSVASSLNPSQLGQAVTFMATLHAQFTIAYAGQVDILDGSVLLATTQVSPAGVARYTTSALSVGSHGIVASFHGAANGLQASTSATLQQVVVQAGSSTRLSASPNPTYSSQPVVLLATVSASSGLPTGTVTFFDGAVALGSVPLTSGVATFPATGLGVGSHLLSASYSGDPNTLASQSPAVPEVVLLSDFTVTSTPASLSVRTAYHLTFTLTAASQGVFNDRLLLTNGVLPEHVTLRPHSSSLTLGPGGTTSVSIYLDTDDVIGYRSQILPDPAQHGTTGRIYSFAALSGLILSFGLSGRRRKRAALHLSAVALLGLSTLTGCSGKYPASTAPGTYTLQLTLTGQTTGTTHTVVVPLVVTE